MNTDFKSILSRKASDIERPKVLPVGSYQFITRGIPRQDVSAQQRTPFVEFTCVPQGPVMGDNGPLDVDEEALEAALTRKSGEKIDITSKAMRLTFYLTDDAAYRLVDFLKNLGFVIGEGDDDDDEPSLEQIIQESQNRTFGGFVTHSMSRDSKTTYANITRTFPIE